MLPRDQFGRRVKYNSSPTEFYDTLSKVHEERQDRVARIRSSEESLGLVEGGRDEDGELQRPQRVLRAQRHYQLSVSH